MKRTLTWSGLLAGLSCMALMAGCGGGDGGTGSTPNPAQDIFAVTTGGSLVRLDNIGLANLSTQALTGLAGGETVFGVDFRPATGQLYILGSTGQLYTVNTTTAVATAVGAPLTLSGSSFGFDFNPSVDRIRIISSNGENLRVNPDTGALAGTDTNISPAGVYAAAAYTPASPGNPTTLYDFEVNGSQFGTQGGVDGNPSPNGGVFMPIANLGINISSETQFDIDSQGNGFFTTFDGAVTRLYYIDLDNGDIEELASTPLRLAGMSVLP